MRISIKLLTGVLLVSVSMLMAACSDQLLDVKTRNNSDLTTALNTPEGLDAGLNGVYDRMQSVVLYGRDMLAVAEALGDNAWATNKSGRLNSENRNTPQNTFGTATAAGATWQAAYIAINQANLLLEAAPNVTSLTDTNRRNSILGQAYFLRALLYHDLMRVYAYDPGVEIAAQSRGGVPLILVGVSDQSKITYPVRSPIADVYKQIYSDLQAAITAFSRSSANAGNVPAYGNRTAAQLLLARVALYNKDYATAVKYATDAIGGTVKVLDATGYVAGWRAPRHPESVFELQFAVVSENIGVNTSLQTSYTTLVRVGDRNTTGGFGDLVPTTAFLADLRSETATGGVAADVRSQLYELGTAGRGTAYVECTKFLGKNGTINLDNVPILRIPEAYLIRAEANYMLGNTATALTDLNFMRTNRGLVARTATDLPGAALLDEILRQRRFEYAFEGHRWFDLKRRGQDVIKTLPLVTTPNNLPYNDYRILANIPVNELSTNKNIKQNFGY